MEKSNENSLDLSKILAKIMQSSYKKKEVSEVIDRIIKKIECKVINKYDEMEVAKLRMEFEEIRKKLYDF